jgi:hypothetical protein
VRAALVIVAALAIPSCYGTHLAPPRVPGAADYSFNFIGSDGTGHISVTAPRNLTLRELVQDTDKAAVLVQDFHEPGDWAHRNYCGAGASQVLLSGWLQQVPGIESVATSAHLNPSRGQTGADTAIEINAFLDPVVVPLHGRSWYRPEHVTNLDDVVAHVRSDLTSPEAIHLFGHGAPVMVQTMTRTMPGWNHWNATHMITIFGFDFSHHDPALDTVSYAETPSPLAGYRGPDFQTISLEALWVAMQAYNREAPSDPINVIW